MARHPSLPAEVIIAALPRGALGLGGLQARFPDVPRRTLQRRLARLVEEGLLETEGNARARTYRVASGAEAVAVASDPAIRLSEKGQAVRAEIRRPLAERRPVGYRPAFLEAYEPNLSYFLPRSLRAHLHATGRSPVEGRAAGTYARQVLDRLLVDLSWASSRLAGNTYSRLETRNLVQLGHEAPGKDRLEAQMILNHKAAIEMLVGQAEEIGFDRYTLQHLHALLSRNLLPDPACGGRLRRTEAAIAGSVYLPLAVPQQIEARFDTFLAKARAIRDPFEQAFFAMVQLPYLLPFDEANKRTSRLAANIPLIRGNLAPLSFVDVPENLYVEGMLGVYELNRAHLLRDVFAWAYERSCQRYTAGAIRQADCAYAGDLDDPGKEQPA